MIEDTSSIPQYLEKPPESKISKKYIACNLCFAKKWVTEWVSHHMMVTCKLFAQ